MDRKVVRDPGYPIGFSVGIPKRIRVGGFGDMVCKKCESKLGTVICPDKWKDGARNTTESNKLRVNPNSVLIKKAPGVGNKCKLCKSALHQPGHYCQGCAYKKGICAMCGVKILDTKFYRQSSV